MSKMNPLKLVAIVLFLCSLFVGISALILREPVAETSKPEEIITSPQVFISRDVLAGERLKEQDLNVEQVLHFNPKGFSSFSSVVGKIATTDLTANTVVLNTQLREMGPAAQLLKKDERAVAIKIDEVTGVGGYIAPGDYVDVLMYATDNNDIKRRGVSQIVLSNLRVISIGDVIQEPVKQKNAFNENLNPAENNQNNTPQATSRSAVLAVDEKGATKLMLAANIGQLRLALRGEDPLIGLLALESAPTDEELNLQDGNILKDTVTNAAIKKPEDDNSTVFDNHFVVSEELLKAPATKPDQTNQHKANEKRYLRKSPSTVEIIVHNGNKTSLVKVKDSAKKGAK